MIRVTIHVAVEDTISWQTQFNQTFSEMLTVIDGIECDEDRDQEKERQRFYEEVKAEWHRDVKRLTEYSDYLTTAEEQLALPGSRKWGDRLDHEEAVTR